MWRPRSAREADAGAEWRPRRQRRRYFPSLFYSLNLILATWSSLLVEMSGVKSTLGPTRV